MISKQLLQFYGLNRNPFGPELCRALQPQTEDELYWYAKVDGFGERVQFIEEWFAKPEHLQERAIIMVYGPKGCGSSSVANYILHYFCQTKQLSMQQVSPLSVTVTNHHDMKPIQDLLGELYLHFLGDLKCNLPGFMENWYDKYVLDLREPSTEHRYKLIFSKSMPILNSYNRTPIIVLDKIRSYEQIERCAAVFQDAPLTLITTSDPKIRDYFAQSQLHGFLVELHQLTFQDVEKFLVQRWQLVSNGSSDHPFPKAGIQSVFQIAEKSSTWRFHHVIQICSHILSRHLKKLEHNMQIVGESYQIRKLPSITKEDMFETAVHYMIQVGILKLSRED